jgi:hypothetical protein
LRDAMANADTATTGWMVELHGAATSENRFTVIAENQEQARCFVSERLRISSHLVNIVRILTDHEMRGLELEAGQVRRMN